MHSQKKSAFNQTFSKTLAGWGFEKVCLAGIFLMRINHRNSSLETTFL
jgi:hypothetical protein